MTIDHPLVILRNASPEDSDAVASPFLDSRKTFIDYAPLAHLDSEVRRWIAETLLSSGGVTLAVMGTRVVGMMSTSQKGATAWIDHPYLHSEFVGHGIGEQLLVVAKRSLSRPIRLFTLQQNSGSRRFYEGQGFQLIEPAVGSQNEKICPDALYQLAAGD